MYLLLKKCFKKKKQLHISVLWHVLWHKPVVAGVGRGHGWHHGNISTRYFAAYHQLDVPIEAGNGHELDNLAVCGAQDTLRVDHDNLVAGSEARVQVGSATLDNVADGDLGALLLPTC